MTLGVVLRLAVMALAFTVMAPAQAILGRGRGRLAGWLPVWFHRLFLRLFGIRATVSGPRPHGAATLVLANHVSWLDIAVIGSLAPLSFVAKSEVAGWPVIGLFARLQRSVFVERGRRSGTAAVSVAMAERLAAGETVILFAEGTTGDGIWPLPFRSALIGAAGGALAGQSKVPVRVQPLAIAYTRLNGLPVTRRERPLIAWYGDMQLAPHLAALLAGGSLDVALRWCEPLAAEVAGDRKLAASVAQAEVRRALRVITGREGSGDGSHTALLSDGQSA